LPPEIPAHDTERSTQSTRTPVQETLSLEFTVRVNDHAAITSRHDTENGVPLMIEGSDGLWIEATPTLYDDGWFVVDLDYFEAEPDGTKRLIQRGGRFSTPTLLPDGTRSDGFGGSETVVVGSKGYAVQLTVRRL